MVGGGHVWPRRDAHGVAMELVRKRRMLRVELVVPTASLLLDHMRRQKRRSRGWCANARGARRMIVRQLRRPERRVESA